MLGAKTATTRNGMACVVKVFVCWLSHLRSFLLVRTGRSNLGWGGPAGSNGPFETTCCFERSVRIVVGGESEASNGPFESSCRFERPVSIADGGVSDGSTVPFAPRLGRCISSNFDLQGPSPPLTPCHRNRTTQTQSGKHGHLK